MEYQKIPTVFERDNNGTKKLVEGSFVDPAIGYLKDNLWEFTEKVDGTNVRIMWNGHKVSFGGRTEDAQIPAKLYDKLSELFCGEDNEQIFEQKFGDNHAIIYGEGYGPGIGKSGKLYSSTMGFIAFDVKVGEWWLERHNVEDVAKSFAIPVVPIIMIGTIADGVKFVKTKPMSTIGTAPMEGLVGRPTVQLFNRAGQRIITKIKVRDFGGI